jgi:hypothetical protein
VYYPKYEMGGKLWPIMHNTMVFSLVLTHIIALGVFTIKNSPVATGFTIILLIGTILFNEYCRQRFARIFNSFSAQVIYQHNIRRLVWNSVILWFKKMPLGVQIEPACHSVAQRRLFFLEYYKNRCL